jgi:DNA polymerase V
MKITKLPKVRTNYQFEAPVLEASRTDEIPEHLRKVRKMLDLNRFLAPNPDNIFLVRVSGDSMIGADIFDGDILVVDRQEKPSNGKIVIAEINGEMAVKYLRIESNGLMLESANSKYKPIEISEYYEFQIQGVVRHVIRDV